MKRHLRGFFSRGRTFRRQNQAVKAAVLEALEDRRMLTVIQSSLAAGPAVFTFQQSPPPAEFGSRPAAIWAQVNQTGNTTAELIGATVDENNRVILTDIPGNMLSPFVPNGNQVQLGGPGGYNGGTLIGPINITDPLNNRAPDAATGVIPDPPPNPGGLIGVDLPGAALGAQNNTAANLASSPNGTLATINVTHNGRVQVDTYNAAPANGNAQVQARINEATLQEDRLGAIAYAAGILSIAGDIITSTAMDPLPDPATGDSMLYVLSQPAGSLADELTVIDVNTNTAVAQSHLFSSLLPGVQISDSHALAFRTVPGGRELWIFTPDYDSNNNVDADHIPVPTVQNTGGGGGGGGGPVITLLNPNYDPALVRVDISNIRGATFGNWPVNIGADPGLRNVTDIADGFEKKINFTALTWSPFDNVFIAAGPQPVTPTAAAGGGGGGAAAPLPPRDIFSIPVAINPASSIVQFTDWGTLAIGGAAGGGGGGGGGGGAGAAATMDINGLAISRDASDNVILSALVQIFPTVATDPIRGQLLQVATIPVAGGTFLPLAPAAATAMCRAGMAVQTFGLASSPAIATTNDGIRPFIYTFDGAQIVRGSTIFLPVNAADGTSQVSVVEAAAFNPIDPNRLYFAPTLGGGNAAGGGGGGGAATGAQLLCSIDLDPANFTPTATNSTIIQNTLRVGGAMPILDAKNQAVHVTGIAFDQTGPATAVLHAINGNNGNVSGGVNVPAGVNTINLARPGFNGNIPLIFTGKMGQVNGLVYIGSGVISRGGQIVGASGENPAGAEQYAWTTTVTNGRVELVRINPAVNRAMLWGAVNPEVEVGGLTFDPNAFDPITQQFGSLLATNPGIVVNPTTPPEPTRDTMFRIDLRFRPNECNIFQSYTALSDSNSLQTIYQVQIPPAPIIPIPYTGSVGPIRVENAQNPGTQDTAPFTVSPNAATGSLYLGARTRKIFTTTPPYEDLWPVTSATLLNTDGTLSTTGFGLVPFGTGTIVSGMQVAATNTGAPQDFGRFLWDGTLTGQVHISGSMDYFYAGWVLVGDPTTPPIYRFSPGGAVAGLPYLTLPYSNTDHAGDFTVGGDLRNFLTLDTIGSDSGTAGAALTYLTRGKFVVGGRVGEMHGLEDLVGTVDVANTPNNAASMPLTEQIHEVELQTNGAQANINAAFAAGYEAQPTFFNDTFATAQYVGAINSTRGNNVIDIAGLIQAKPTTVDDNDYYAVSLMAGQVIRVSMDDAALGLDLIDPDGRVVATNQDFIAGAEIATAPVQWTTDRPGSWRIHVYVIPLVIGGVPGNHLAYPYDVFLQSAPSDTYGMNIAVGAVRMAGCIFDAPGNNKGTSFNARNGDMGALIAGTAMNLASPPDQLLDEDTYETSGLPPQGALLGATVNVTLGNLRDMQGATIVNPSTDVFNGSVGLLTTTGGDLQFNTAFFNFGLTGIPRANDHDPAGVARQTAVGGDIQRVQASGNLSAGLMANGRIGVINVGSWGALGTQPAGLPAGTVAAEPLGFLVANADNQGSDGTIDLIDVTGDVGRALIGGLAGGPGIITGPGGNVRYMHVGGNLHRDSYFGGSVETDDATLYRPGESISFMDDSGTPMLIQPVATVPVPVGGVAPSITLRAYGVRGSGGSAIVNITSTDSVTVSAQGISPNASVEIGTVTVGGAGTAVAPGANGQFIAPAVGLPRLAVNFGGTAAVDVFDLVGGNFYQVQNNSKSVDNKRNAVDYGELVNITATSIFNLTAANIGVPKQSTDQAIIGNVARLNAFPFLGQTTGVVVGNLGYVTALGAIGNINSTGIIGTITADSDRKITPGVLTSRVHAPLEGIVAPIASTGGINTVWVGRGMTTAGNALLLSWGGLYSNGPIGNVTADGADIYGAIVSTTSIGTINVRNNGSLIWADIGVPTALNGMQKALLNTAVVDPPAPITDPTIFQINNINVQGSMPVRGVAAKTGGIIGCNIAAGRINNISVTRGFGIINTAIGTSAQTGRLNTIATDGYGIRDVIMGIGVILGKMTATGNGTQLPSTGFSTSVRKSETMDIDPSTHFPPNRATDLHRYLGTSTANPTIANDNNRAGITRSGVIAGSTVIMARTMDTAQAWRITFSNQMGFYSPTDFHVQNSIKSITTTESMIDPQITTGTLGLLSIGKDLHSPNIHVSGLFSTLKIGGDYTIEPTSRTDEIDALGPNGSIGSVNILGRMDGNIKATVKIGPHKVGKKTGTGKFYVNGVQIA